MNPLSLNREDASSAECGRKCLYSGFRIPVCPICRDQVQDFVWVSLIQTALLPAGFISGLQFAIEEVLLFGILVLVKHRLPSVFDRFLRQA